VQMQSVIENISRALILKNDRLLLVRQVGHDYTFLPGGHIEFGEKAESAMIREIFEELGINGRCGKFITVIENFFSDAKGVKCHEIAYYFLFHPDKKLKESDFVSLEPHIEFIWADVDDIDDFNLKPDILPEIIRSVVAGEKPARLYTCQS
jgi:8-oxo-dGTP diphosphatase